jgi:phage repressor protein C with HTH and peptisase S24 domain
MTECNSITQRFLECFEYLLKHNKVRSARQFAIQLGYLPQSFSEIQKGRRDVPLETLRKAVEVFQLNPEYLLLGKGGVFYDESQFQKTRILPIVTTDDGKENIVHVPVKAQAGYAGDRLETTTFFEHLPTYRLPDYAYSMGTFRSFEVSGDSMYPTLEDSDTIICSYVDNNYWESSVKDNHVYVIVTQGDVFVKRVINNLRKHRHLELHSDNDHYPLIRINLIEIKEIWMVKSRINRFNHSRNHINLSQSSEMEALRNVIEDQRRLIKDLQQLIGVLNPA